MPAKARTWQFKDEMNEECVWDNIIIIIINNNMVEMRRDVQLSLYLCDISIYFLGDFPYHDKNKEIKVPNKFQIIIYYGM